MLVVQLVKIACNLDFPLYLESYRNKWRENILNQLTSLLLIVFTLLGRPLPHSHAGSLIHDSSSHGSRPHFHLGLGHHHDSAHKHRHGDECDHNHHDHGKTAMGEASDHANAQVHPKTGGHILVASQSPSFACFVLHKKEVVRLTSNADSRRSHRSISADDLSENRAIGEVQLSSSLLFEHDCDAIYVNNVLTICERSVEKTSTSASALVTYSDWRWDVPNIVSRFRRQSKSSFHPPKLPIYLMRSSLLV